MRVPQTFDDVRAARDALPADDPRQQGLAMEDRRTFAREWTRDTKGLAGISLLVAVPLEAAYKATVGAGRSGRTEFLPTVGAGYTGIWQGLKATLGLDKDEGE